MCADIANVNRGAAEQVIACCCSTEYMVNEPPPFFFSLRSKLACSLGGIITETHIHLKHTGVQQDDAEELPPNVCRLASTAPVYI